MDKDFQQNAWNAQLEAELKKLLAIAVFEDTEAAGDITSLALIPDNANGSATVRARQSGVVAGIQAVQTILAAVDERLLWTPTLSDGDLLDGNLSGGMIVGKMGGPVQKLLTAERLVLNLLGKLSGIASLTRKYVDAVSGTSAKIYDTRKTTLGWRRLEKYAVVCGGGRNHRTGLFDAVLIKDNHLAFGQDGVYSPAQAVEKARQFVPPGTIIEIEVDTLQQLEEVLPANPDYVLLDNMGPEMLKQAVEMRNKLNNAIALEASGGVNLSTVRAIAETGVDRISVGALTHSATALDLGLDWA